MSEPGKMDSEEGATAKQAAPKISLSLSGNNSARTQTLTQGLKRPHTIALQDDEDHDDASHGRTQRVSQFDRSAGGAINTSHPSSAAAAPLVIPRQANRDWRAAANSRKRQKSGLPAAQEVNEADARAMEAEAERKKPGFGLTVAAKTTSRAAENGERAAAAAAAAADAGAQGKVDDDAETGNTAPSLPPTNGHAKTDEQRAIDALLGHDTTDHTLVVPHVTETEAFDQDFRHAPSTATLDDYVRVPVEQFGAAMLRGMGWKDGDGVGLERGGTAVSAVRKNKVNGLEAKPLQRRPALLGIGAKEDAAVALEMGAWGKGARGGKEVKIFNPVVLKNGRTGEMLTEEELKEKKEREERERYEMEFERRERRRENGHGRRDDERRDDRDRERRRRDDDGEEEYQRRRERERRNRPERDGRESDYDRDRSRRHRGRDERDEDYDRERSRRHRDRDERDRHRDSDRHRERDRRR